MTTRTLATITQATNNSGDTGFTYRMRVGSILAPSLGQVRVTFGGSTTASLGVLAAYIGIWDGVATAALNTNTVSAPVQLTFTVSSLSSFTCAAGTTTLSNWVNLTGFTSANDLVVSIDLDSVNGNSRQGPNTGGQSNYYSATVSASVAQSTKATTAANSSVVEAVVLIEAQPTDAFVCIPSNSVRTIYKTVDY